MIVSILFQIHFALIRKSQDFNSYDIKIKEYGHYLILIFNR